MNLLFCLFVCFLLLLVLVGFVSFGFLEKGWGLRGGGGVICFLTAEVSHLNDAINAALVTVYRSGNIPFTKSLFQLLS